ncbi:MAG: phosphatidate cytidylyltransferase [Clostridia bacterium]|nr:phosphatidate cytidylyltransferase [Clostridia bacterium]
MLTRVITGSVIFIVSLAFVLLKQVSFLFFDAFALIIMLGALNETIKAYRHSKVKVSCIPLYLSVLMLACTHIFAKTTMQVLTGYIFITIFVILYALTEEIIIFARNRKRGLTETNAEILNKTLFDKAKFTMMVFAYPIVPLSFFFAMNHLPYEIGYIGIVLIFAVSMLTDTMAYFVGMLCGKQKFIPEVSPKKTIQGVVGGFLGGIIGALACFFVFYYTDLFSVLNNAGMLKSILSFIGIGIVGSYVNQLGDLIASALKRKIGIKDYSNLFPGHGGFMDRVDGMMFEAVFIYAVLALLFV